MLLLQLVVLAQHGSGISNRHNSVRNERLNTEIVNGKSSLVKSNVFQDFAEFFTAVYHFSFTINDPAEDMVISSPPFQLDSWFTRYVQLIAV